MVAGPTIDSQTLTYVQSVLETIPPVHPSLTSAIDAFQMSFNRWNPDVLADIGINDKLTIDFLFSELTTTNNHLDAYTKNILSICQEKIYTIVENFNTEFSALVVPKEELEQLIDLLQAGCWEKYNTYTKENTKVDTTINRSNTIFLPTIQELQVRIDEIGQEDKLVQGYLSIQIHGTSHSLVDLLVKHSCTTTIARNKKKNGYYINEDILEASNILEQLERLRFVFGPTPDIAYQLMYFSIYPSLIFGDVRTLMYRQSVADIAIAVKERSKALLEAFGSEMNYNSVCNVLQKHFPTNDDIIINKEITTNLNCKVLKISALDITHFRTIRLLRDVKSTVQEFMDTCDLYKFDIVTKDPSFVALQESVKEFYLADTNDRTTCLSFLDQLFTVLCPLPENGDQGHDNAAIMKDPYISLLYKMHRLNTICTSGLKLFSYGLQGPELWEFFRSMNWFRNDNEVIENDDAVLVTSMNNKLIQFYENYDALHYILQQYGATNEMVIIESLEPVVRLFNFVQQNEHVTTLHEVVTNMENVYDIFYSDGADHRDDLKSIVQNIYELDGRSESLKDLFYRICGNPLTTSTK